jgi:predicted secreted protein
MTGYEALITYVIVWWLIFFMVLPWGSQPLEQPEPGMAESAPAKPRILLKVAITSVLAGLATWGVAWVIQSGLIQLRP